MSEPVEARRKTVVVVEDDPELQDLEVFVLRAEGHDAVAVGDGVEAASTIRRVGADLVLLDLMLPGRDGNAVLAELASEPTTANVPVIVLSAFLQQLRPTSQVKRILNKPFDVGDLIEAIAEQIGPGQAV